MRSIGLVAAFVVLTASIAYAALDDPKAAKNAVKCQQTLSSAALELFKDRLTSLNKCVAKVFKCVQRKEAGLAQEKCLKAARKACRVIDTTKTNFDEKVRNGCARTDPQDLASADGLNFDARAPDCASLGFDTRTGSSKIADCIAEHHTRTADRLYAIQGPRARELIKLADGSLPSVPDLPGFEGCENCAVGEKGKETEKCAATIRTAGAKFLTIAVKSAGKCINAHFACTQLKRNSTDLQICRNTADNVCLKAQRKATEAQASATVAVNSTCSTVPFLEESALNIRALECDCDEVGVEDLDDLGDYVECSRRQHGCRALDMLSLEAPSLAQLPDETKRSLTAALCPTPAPRARSAVANGTRASVCQFKVGLCRFLRFTRGKFTKAGVERFAEYRRGGAPARTRIRAPEERQGPTRFVLKARSNSRLSYGPFGSRLTRVSYQRGIAPASGTRQGPSGNPPSLLIGVMRLDGSLVDEDVFALPLETGNDDEDIDLGLQFDDAVSSCNFRLVMTIEDDEGVDPFTRLDVVAPGCLDGAPNESLDDGEECDDGNQIDTDGCTNECTIAACGDGRVQGGEVCDDANLIDGDGCDFQCRGTTSTPTPTPAMPMPTSSTASTPTLAPTPSPNVTPRQVKMRLTASTDLEGVQFHVSYPTGKGSFQGTADAVACTYTGNGIFAANDLDNGLLLMAVANASEVQFPIEVECTFLAVGSLTAADFSEAIEEVTAGGVPGNSGDAHLSVTVQ